MKTPILNVSIFRGNRLYILILFLQTTEDIALDPRPEYHRAVLTWLPHNPVPRAVSTGISELDLHKTSFLTFYSVLPDSIDRAHLEKFVVIWIARNFLYSMEHKHLLITMFTCLPTTGIIHEPD